MPPHHIATHTSRIGMLISSMKSTKRWPAIGPYTPFRRFSHLPSITSCVMFADVWAEKVNESGT